MNEIQILSINLNKLIKLHLVVKIEKTKNAISISNDKLNIRSVYENDETLEEAKDLYALFVLETLMEYAKEEILHKVFKSANIKIRPIEDVKNEINNQVKNLVNEENGLLTKPGELVNLQEYEEIETSLAIAMNNINESIKWELQQ